MVDSNSGLLEMLQVFLGPRETFSQKNFFVIKVSFCNLGQPLSFLGFENILISKCSTAFSTKQEKRLI